MNKITEKKAWKLFGERMSEDPPDYESATEITLEEQIALWKQSADHGAPEAVHVLKKFYGIDYTPQRRERE